MQHIHNEKLSLSKVSQCCLCNSMSSKIAVSDVKDNVSFAVEYTGNILECLDCGHAFLSPIINKNDIHKAYSGYYTQIKDNIEISSNSKKDRFSFFKEYYNYLFRGIKSKKGIIIFYIIKLVPFAHFFLSRASRFLKVPQHGEEPTLLDVGCGRGDFLMRSSYCGYSATGIDFDPETIEIARLRGFKEVYVKDIKDIPDGIKYDAITLSHVIEHVEDPQSLINDIYIRLKPGGYFYLATPNFNSAGRKTFSHNWRGCDVPRHMHFFNTASLENMLLKTGFKKANQVYDLIQSVGVIRSSFNLQSKDDSSKYSYFKSVLLLIWNKFYLPDRLEVSVFKCYK